MRDALANIRLAFVEIKGRAGAADRRADRDRRSGSRPRLAVTSRPDAGQRRRKRPIGASTTRPARTVTPSARSSAAWPAAGRWPGGRRCARPATTAGRVGLLGEQRADGPGPAGEPGVVGDVAVADDLALAERHDHGDEALAPARVTVATGAGWRASSSPNLTQQRRTRRRRRPSIVRVPSAISTQWNRCTVPSSAATWPSPTCSSKSMTRPNGIVSGRSWRSGSRAGRSRRRP